MAVYRALPLVAVLVATPIAALAQFGGMPGMPGGMPGGMPAGPGGFGQPQQPPAACQQLVALRDETQKAGLAIQKANEHKASVQDACKLFRTFLSAETRFMKGIEENGATCGAPPDLIKQVKEGHAKASQIAKQVCDAAAQGPRPTGPSLSDALGVTPSLPDNSSGTKTGSGAFDTLSGNVLQR